MIRGSVLLSVSGQFPLSRDERFWRNPRPEARFVGFIASRPPGDLSREPRLGSGGRFDATAMRVPSLRRQTLTRSPFSLRAFEVRSARISQERVGELSRL